MSIVTTDLICYGCASIPVDDASTTGGAIDITRRPVFTQFTSSAKLALISDGSDTRNVTIAGRDSTGALSTEVVALTNAVEVLSVNTYERIQSVNAASSSGTRTVTLKQGTGGTTIATIPVNEVGVYMMFQNSFSSTGTQVRTEKLFWKNTNGTLTLTSSTVTLTADPDAKITIALAASLNDSTTISDRTQSTGLTFSDDGVALSLPSSGNLAAASRIGVWIKQTLGASDPALKSTFTTQLAGNSI